MSINNRAHAQVLDHSTKIQLRNESMIYREENTINISNFKDRKAGEVEIRIGKNSNFKLLYAKIRDREGKIVRTIKKKEIHEVSLRSRAAFFDDSRIVKFEMHWHEYPYQISYAYEEKMTDFIYSAYWYPFSHENMITINSSLELDIPVNYKLNIFSSPQLKFTEGATPENRRKMRWENKLYKLPKSEKYAPPLTEKIPQVLAVPDKFKYGIIGKSSTWKDYGQWFYELNSNTEDLPESEKQIIDSLIINCKTKREIVRKLYHYLQDNTQYVNVSIDYGGLKSYPASYVSKNKYGDCKALTTYMKAMLKHVGIESYYALINTGINQARLKKSLPSPQFNHVILCIPIDGEILWLENTSNTLPYDYLSLYNQNRYVLVVDDNESKLIKTPAVTEEEVTEHKTFKYFIDVDGAGTIIVSSKIRGRNFQDLNYIKRFWDKEDQKEVVRNYFNLKEFKLMDWDIKQKNRDSHFITLTIGGEISKQIKKVSKLKVIQIPPLHIEAFEKPKIRKQPLRFNFPINRIDTLRYNLSKIKSYDFDLPRNLSLKSRFGSFVINCYKSEDEIKIDRKLTIYSGDYSINEYPDFYEFIQKIEQAQRRTAIILTPP